MKPLDGFKKEADLKIKASSFCSYEKPPAGKTSDNMAERVVQEMGSRFYRSSFSVFELVPKEILLTGLDKNFIAVLFLLFKIRRAFLIITTLLNSPVQPLFDSSRRANKLSLIRETGNGYYLPINGVAVNTNQNLSKFCWSITPKNR